VGLYALGWQAALYLDMCTGKAGEYSAVKLLNACASVIEVAL